jgi:hypothetical protein
MCVSFPAFRKYDLADSGQYAPLLFQSAGLKSSTASFLASGISALLIFLVTIPAYLLADR